MRLEPLPYHLKVRDHFKKQKQTWSFFEAAGTKEEQLLQLQSELLKNTYKFSPVSEAFIYEQIDLAKQKLGLGNLAVTAYQAQHNEDSNASILFIHNVAHLVFSGNITQKLDSDELLAVITHELAHIKFYSFSDGELETADRIINAIAGSYECGPSYRETARLFRLYLEIFCDRAAYSVLEREGPVISMLVKIATGLDKVDPDTYLRQAEEVIAASGSIKTSMPTHPENFIRAKALHLWHSGPADAEEGIIAILEGGADLDRLDIFSQEELTGMTRSFLQSYLQPVWYQTAIIGSLAKQYFSGFSWSGKTSARPMPETPAEGNPGPEKLPEPASEKGDRPEGIGNEFPGSEAGEQGQALEAIRAKIAGAHGSIRDYFSYVLLDFALADPSLEEVPAGRAFHFAERLGLEESYAGIVKKQLQLSDKKMQQYKQKSLTAYRELKED